MLVDRLGRSRITMQVTDDGPAISMFDDKGQKRLELAQTSNASGIRLFDSSEPVVSLQLNHHGDPASLEIRGPQGSALMKSDGLSVHDASNQGRLHLGLLNGSVSMLGMSQSGQNGPPSIELTANEGARSLKIHDQDGLPLFSVVAAHNSETFLTMRHPLHEQSLQISTGSKDVGGPTMAFFAPANEDGSGGLLPRLQLGLGRERQPQVRIVDSDGQTLFAAPSQ